MRKTGGEFFRGVYAVSCVFVAVCDFLFRIIGIGGDVSGMVFDTRTPFSRRSVSSLVAVWRVGEFGDCADALFVFDGVSLVFCELSSRETYLYSSEFACFLCGGAWDLSVAAV